MRIAVIVGTRPEAIKMAPVYLELKRRQSYSPLLVLTGQHKHMARDVLELFEIAPDLDLGVMDPGQNLMSLCARLTAALAEVFAHNALDAILVQGDTTSAMIAGILGFNAGCPIGHVEAGLRTGNLASPFPEEFNRRVISLAAYWHFAPTASAAENLQSEGVMRNVFVVGNTVIDAALDIANRHTARVARMHKRMDFLGGQGRRHVLVTTHRRENFGAPMSDIARAVKKLAESFSEIDFVVPIHPNPKVGAVLRPALRGFNNVYLIEPLEYDELLHVMKTAFMVLTDSGGIQEEAPTFDVPVLVMRNETERMEGVNAGCSLLVGPDTDRIVSTFVTLANDQERYGKMAQAKNPYGDGTASRIIADILQEGY